MWVAAFTQLGLQQVLSEFSPDSVIKPVRVLVTRVLHHVSSRF